MKPTTESEVLVLLVWAKRGGEENYPSEGLGSVGEVKIVKCYGFMVKD
jgi:hypothetical protein